LLHDIYADNAPSSLAPRNFKTTIGRYGASFSGYAQQDSQEFLGFLLDGLQEDLNRIHKKPYIEKPDSTDEMVKTLWRYGRWPTNAGIFTKLATIL
jgi:ubiquitin carboxyl-terminal hydrolase 4/11/15